MICFILYMVYNSTVKISKYFTYFLQELEVIFLHIRLFKGSTKLATAKHYSALLCIYKCAF